MIGNFVAVSPQQLASLIANPEEIESLLHPEGGDALSNHLDIDKAWHAIHFTLNGKTWEGEAPLSLVILGGEPIGDDLGYGPARYLTPDQVKAVAAALSKVPLDVFANQFDSTAMDAADIYPQMWVRDGEEGLRYVQHYYAKLASFYQLAAGRGDAALLFLN